MGWIGRLLNNVVGVAPTEWTLAESVPDPGFGIAGKTMTRDQCYLELYVELLRLEKARRLATTFNGVVYSFVSLARDGAKRAELASVTKPANLSDMDPGNLDRVISVSKRIMSAMPWRGDPLGLELGLFSVKTGNLLTPLTDYVTRIADKAGIGVVGRLDPFLPLITEGLDMIAGQTSDTAIELAIDTDMSLDQSRLCALIAKQKGTLNLARLTVDKADRKLLYDGRPLDAAYCVFSIRHNDRNIDWGEITALQESYQDFKDAILEGKRKEAEEALAGFNRQVIVSPDLIDSDKDRLKAKARQDLVDAFPGGGQSEEKKARLRFETRTLADLNLYDD